MHLRIVPRRDLSLADLVELHTRGAHVLKTPHVGNHYPNNLAIAKLGIPMLCVDRTIGARDRNFHPHRVICGGTATDIAHAERIVTHATVTQSPPEFATYFPPGGSILEGHMRALRDVFPKTRIVTEADSLQSRGERIFTFLETLTRIRPSAWRRVVNEDGYVRERSRPRSWEQVRMEGVHDVALVRGAGWIVPNEWCILWDAVNAAHDGATELYELSGPDMIRYIDTMVPELNALYVAFRDALPNWRLPECLTMYIVPVAAMRFVVPVSRRRALEHLFESHARLTRMRGEWSAQMQSCSPEIRAREIERIAKERSREMEAVREAVHDLPEIFYEIDRADFLSQYDLIRGTELFIHPRGVEAPLSEVEMLMQQFVRFRNGSGR